MEPTAILKKYVEERQSRRKQLSDRIAYLQQKVAVLDMTIEDLEKALAEMESHKPASIELANGSAGNGDASHSPAPAPFIRPKPGKPKASVPSLLEHPPQKISHLCLGFVNDHPEGMRPSEIADLLRDKMESKSADPRRVVMNTLINLATQGKIRR
ncbi:MAG TPA: hypothetical protein VMV10_10400, partial [Pirellulales bacterium]|nr:hypothetical protein [Pirellulales bacterium]